MSDIVRGCVLWQEPLIVYTTPLDKPFSFTSQFPDDFADQDAVILPLIAWSAELPISASGLAESSRSYEAQYPRHQVWNMCNTEEEVLALQRLGARGYFMNHNVFVDYNKYTIQPDVVKIYGAIYNAQIAKFKRHWLCSDLDNVAFLYHSGGPTQSIEASKLFAEIRAAVPGAHFLNEAKDPITHPGLSTEEVSIALNQARVGLCLSEVEGAMHASIEYLFSGLPIVSTPSKGGRDLFFDDDFCLITEPVPHAIATAVNALHGQGHDPCKIRSRTIEAVERHRRRFTDFIDQLLLERGVHTTFSQLWPAVYFDKLLTWETKEAFRRRLKFP